MRLLVLAHDFYPNVSGGALTRWRFCQLAVESGHEVTVFTPRTRSTSARETVDGVRIRRPLPARPSGVANYSTLATISRIVYTCLLFWYLLVWLWRNDMDGIHSASNTTHWLATVLGKITSLPVVTFMGYTPSLHGENDTPWLKSKLESINVRLFMGDAICCRLESTRDRVDEIADKPTYLVHGILHEPAIRAAADSADRGAIRERFDVGSDQRLFVYVGRFVPVKRVPAAVSILEELSSDDRLVMIGDGPVRPAVEERVEELGLEDRVTLTGELPHEKTLSIVAAADALVLTSETESYAAAALEALALGRHVFATPVGVLPSVKHPRLHLAPLSALPETVATTTLDPAGVDHDMLDQYAMEQYTETILQAFEEQATTDGSQHVNRQQSN